MQRASKSDPGFHDQQELKGIDLKKEVKERLER
jgi:hypothetical protein